MRRKASLHSEVVTLVRDEDFDVESFIDSVIDEERTKTELKTLSRKISELGARVVQISERIEKTLNQLNERVTSLETDFEEIIEALTQFQAAALQAPKGPSMPAASPTPTSGPKPPAISAPPSAGTPSVPAPAVAAPGPSAPSIGQPGTVAPPNLTAPPASTPPPNLSAPAGAGSGPSSGPGGGGPGPSGPPMGAGPGGISQSAIAEALGSLKKAPPPDEKPKPKAPVSGPNAVLSELSQVLQRRRKRSQEGGEESGGGLKPVKPKVMRDEGEEEEEEDVVKPKPAVQRDNGEAPVAKKKITSAAEMKSLLEKRLKSALSQDSEEEE